MNFIKKIFYMPLRNNFKVPSFKNINNTFRWSGAVREASSFSRDLNEYRQRRHHDSDQLQQEIVPKSSGENTPQEYVSKMHI